MIKRVYKKNSDYIYKTGTVSTIPGFFNGTALNGLVQTFMSASGGKSIHGYTRFKANDRTHVYGYVLEKHRKVVKAVKPKKNKDDTYTKRVIVSRGHIAYRIYKFAIDDVVEFKQHARTFSVVLRSA